MKKNRPIVTIIGLLCIIIIALIIAMIIFIKKNNDYSFIRKYGETIKELQVDKTYENTFNKILIDTEATDIEIKKSQNETTQLKVYAEEDKVEVTENVYENLSELKIKVKTTPCKFLCLNFNKKISKIELYIPENYDKEIKIENNYGNIDVESFKNLNLNIDEDAGNIKIDAANKVDIKNNYGDITINEIIEGKLNSSAGNIEVNKVNIIDAKNNHGNTKIKEINEYVRIDADAGDIKIDKINITRDSSIETNLGTIRIDKINEIYVDASTDLGTTSINENYRESDITLNLESNLGDIKVN